jgi:phage-related protein
MFDGTTPCWRPSNNWSRDLELRMQTAQFGDGYMQRTLDGINPNKVTFNLNFNGRPSSVILAMDAYLNGLKGFAFPFMSPLTNTVRQVFCDKWSITIALRKPGGAWIGNLTAVFYSANDGSGM